MASFGTTAGAQDPSDAALTADDARELLLNEMAVINLVIAGIGRRHRVSSDEMDDFSAYVQLKLIENDYAILRRFRRRSTLHTYLRTVITRLLLDYRVSMWGRWRPSVEAVKSGPIGVLLDRLIHRDGLSFDEAFEAIRTNHCATVSRDALYEMAARLPIRQCRRDLEADVSNVPTEYGCPETALERQRTMQMAGRIRSELRAALASLPAEDRRLLELRFREGRTVIEIASLLGVSPKPLYVRFERIVRSLRQRILQCTGPHGASIESFQLSGVSIWW